MADAEVLGFRLTFREFTDALFDLGQELLKPRVVADRHEQRVAHEPGMAGERQCGAFQPSERRGRISELCIRGTETVFDVMIDVGRGLISVDER